MWYVYILRSLKDRKLYIGSTNDLKRRMQEHEGGTCIATAQRRPLSCEMYIAVATEKKSRRLERYLKSGSGMAILKKRILQEIPREVVALTFAGPLVRPFTSRD